MTQHTFKIPGRVTWRERLSRWWMLRKMTIEERAEFLEVEQILMEQMIAGRDSYVTSTGQLLTNIHRESDCEGTFCVIHNPSDHHMRDWPTYWRQDRGMMERICPHGIGHPDPDDANPDHVHGCDGCCSER